MSPDEQLEMVARAFVQFVDARHRNEDYHSPPIDGLCGNCGFPVYSTADGFRGQGLAGPQIDPVDARVCEVPERAALSGSTSHLPKRVSRLL